MSTPTRSYNVSLGQADGERDWFSFIAASGAEGRSWVEAFRREGFFELAGKSNEALLLLRKKRLAEGHAVLRQVEEGSSRLRAVSTSMAYVLDRFYLGVLAYDSFCNDDLDEAERLMIQAHETVERAISLRSILVPLADSALDFRMQRIRIARARRDWQKMNEHIAITRGMFRSEIPLCVLDGHQTVYRKDLSEYYLALENLPENELAFVREVTDDQHHIALFERFAAYIYALPFVVIPYHRSNGAAS